jgi:peptide/nickel transport system substrate-binding protein
MSNTLPLGRRSFTALATSLPVAALIRGAHAATPKDTIVIASQIDDLITLDPGEEYEISGQIMVSNIYDRLVRYEAEDHSKLSGAVAESWQVSPDGKTFTFKIAPNRKFESGAPVTAEDVAFSLQRVVLMGKGPSFLFTQLGWTKDNVKDLVKPLDSGTLQLKIVENFSPVMVLNLMATTAGSVIEKKVALANEKNGDLGNGWLKTHSATCGAYKLISWKANESVTLEALPAFHLPSKVKRVIVRHVPEPATQQLLIQKGDIDMAWSLQPDQLRALANDKNVKLETFPYSGTWYTNLNLGDERLKNPKVRTALRYLVDYEGMVNSFLKGAFTVNQTFLPKGFPAWIDYAPYKLDVAKAKQLLAEAGYPNGFEVKLECKNASPLMEIAQSMQQTMGEGGIKVTIAPADAKQVIANLRARHHQMTLISWTPDYLDPHTNAGVFAMNTDDSDDKPKPLAWRDHYFDPEANRMTVAAAQETDAAKRDVMYAELQKKITDEGPYILMFQPLTPLATRATVTGFNPGIVEDTYFFRTITKS